ncbi:MAG: M2 family metallopeptidase [Desulfovibrionaceae bacterium]|nr:M2 family metallopeptidase [Desulfovibrionaceae bacterium]
MTNQTTEMGKLDKVFLIGKKILYLLCILPYLALMTIWILAAHSCYSSSVNTKKYLAEPQVGDLYTTKVGYIDGSGYDDPQLFGVLKLVSMDGDVLAFSVSKTAYLKSHSLYFLVKEYSDDVIHLPKSDIRRLYDEKIVEEINRK